MHAYGVQDMETNPPPLSRQLTLGTVSFALCFACWGLISAFAPAYRAELHLSATAGALLVAVPVLLGSLARIPMGILTDRFGGRLMFTFLFLACAVAAAILPLAKTYQALLLGGFFLGIAGSSFAVGVGYVSKWFPPARQGAALGVYGLGNIGQSAVIFLGPLLAARIGRQNVFYGLAAILAIWAAVFGILARNAPAVGTPAARRGVLQVFLTERLSWVLALFYFVTFGGFVAFSIYLPSLLRDDFGLSPADAGFRAAGFVVLATALRPAGGILADKIGGARVLSGVFLGIVPFALLLAWRSMIPFTVGALGCASLMGLGNGAVFKLVPQYFPANTGTVTGLVGAMGGLGGFFPPLVLGAFRDRLGFVWPGFFCLAGTSLLMWLLNRRVFVPRQQALEVTLSPELLRTADKLRAGAMGCHGHRATRRIDRRRIAQPPAFRSGHCHLHVRRGLRHLWSGLSLRGVAAETTHAPLLAAQLSNSFAAGCFAVPLPRTAATHLLAQTLHSPALPPALVDAPVSFLGLPLAVAITFPLVFGWIHFEKRTRRTK